MEAADRRVETRGGVPPALAADVGKPADARGDVADLFELDAVEQGCRFAVAR